MDDLLEVSRLEAGRTDLERAPVDLAATVGDAVEAFRSLARERGVELRLESPPRMVASLDPARMQRVVLNLLSNAFKFTPERGTIRVSLRRIEGEAAAGGARGGRQRPGHP